MLLKLLNRCHDDTQTPQIVYFRQERFLLRTQPARTRPLDLNRKEHPLESTRAPLRKDPEDIGDAAKTNEPTEAAPLERNRNLIRTPREDPLIVKPLQTCLLNIRFFGSDEHERDSTRITVRAAQRSRLRTRSFPNPMLSIPPPDLCMTGDDEWNEIERQIIRELSTDAGTQESLV